MPHAREGQRLHLHAVRQTVNTRPLMTLRVSVATPQSIGAVPHGTRRIAALTGGDFEGARLRGVVVPAASADWLLLRSDGVLELDLRATLLTHDGALISMTSFGLRHGPADVIAALGRGEPVDPARYSSGRRRYSSPPTRRTPS